MRTRLLSVRVYLFSFSSIFWVLARALSLFVVLSNIEHRTSNIFGNPPRYLETPWYQPDYHEFWAKKPPENVTPWLGLCFVLFLLFVVFPSVVAGMQGQREGASGGTFPEFSVLQRGIQAAAGSLGATSRLPIGLPFQTSVQGDTKVALSEIRLLLFFDQHHASPSSEVLQSTRLRQCK